MRELRNPLASMRNASHLLSGGNADRASVARAQALIERQTESMTRIVDDCLDLAHIQHGKIGLRSDLVDLGSILARSVGRTEHQRRHQRQEIESTLPSAPVLVRGDAARLEQVFRELLVHAAKFTPPGKRIELALEAPAGHWAIVRIRHAESGAGTSALHLLAVPYAEVEPERDSRGGIGVGLWLAKRLLELHGGALDEPARDDGVAELRLRIPLVPDELRCARKGPARAPRCCRVLIVEDEPDAAGSQLAVLTQAGFIGRVVSDGAEAVAAAHQFLPDVVLLDIGLPGEDGYQVAERLRREADMKDTLLIALTGYGEEEDIARSRAAGFHEHVTKPADQERILRIIARWRSIKHACG